MARTRKSSKKQPTKKPAKKSPPKKDAAKKPAAKKPAKPAAPKYRTLEDLAALGDLDGFESMLRARAARRDAADSPTPDVPAPSERQKRIEKIMWDVFDGHFERSDDDSLDTCVSDFDADPSNFAEDLAAVFAVPPIDFTLSLRTIVAFIDQRWDGHTVVKMLHLSGDAGTEEEEDDD